jgi:glyoxylase-like metal-dependent hydrolase (beta-lactamase superfamily II)
MIQVNHFEEVIQINMSRLLGGKPRYWVAAYLVDGLLVDTGCKHTSNELVQWLTSQNVQLAVNTHYHEDHIGANYILKKRLGIEIVAHSDSVPLINKVPELYPYQELVWGYPDPTEVSCLNESIETDHFRFDVVETPGHCKGHVALVEPNKGWCFSGDLFLAENPRVIRPEENIPEIIESMKTLLQIRTDRLVLFTSGGKVIQDGRKALQSCIEYLEDLSQKAKRLEQKGLTISAIVHQLFGGESPLTQFTDGDFSSKNLILCILRA